MIGHLRYWGFLVLKLTLAGATSVFTLWFLNLFWWPYTPPFHLNPRQFGMELGYTTLVLVWFLFSYGLVYVAIWDQKYRCRTCLRKMMMPVEVGSWSSMLRLGKPEMEYICRYGHGRLNIPEVQISGREKAAWKQHGDVWEELFTAGRETDQDK